MLYLVDRGGPDGGRFLERLEVRHGEVAHADGAYFALAQRLYCSSCGFHGPGSLA